MPLNNLKQYDADIYLRISREDGDKEQSDSIGNQKDLILDYLKTMPDININKIRIDDGYSGVNFDRPAFNEMLADIKAGKVNCVIVKDFSRFGRNYIESGRYIQILFPKAGIRFISVNDNYDSLRSQTFTDNIMVAFKGLMNDAYCADISTKIQSQLNIKRKRGDFIGSFAVYGYLKSDENRNKLIVDEYAAGIVKNIFNWKLEGLSQQGIADKLNENGILSPMEYKKFLGMRYDCPFKVNYTAKWSAVAVGRILKNEVYTGVLEQGKRVTANYKIKQRIEKPKHEWIRVEGAHDSIIDKAIFETVANLLKMDTRIALNNKAVYILSGLIVCGDCKQNMIRKTVPKGSNKYHYFSCSTNRNDKTICSSHSINETDCINAVVVSLKAHIANILNIERMLRTIEKLPLQKNEVRKLEEQSAIKEEEINQLRKNRLTLYEDYKSSIISQEDFVEFKQIYDKKIKETEQIIKRHKEEIEKIISCDLPDNRWIEKFSAYKGIETFDRKTVVELIDKIYVYEGKRIEIIFRYQNEYERLLFLCKEAV